MKYKAITEDRQMRALTGLNIKQFNQLVFEFAAEYQEDKQKAYLAGLTAGKRRRRPGGGQKGKLPAMADKLFFTLVYFKTYPTFDVLGVQFEMGRSKANENLHKLAPILMRTLVRLGVMPYREFKSAADMRTAFKSTDWILIDVTERFYRRSQDYETQRDHFSGKKNVIPSKIQYSPRLRKEYCLSVKLLPVETTITAC